MIQVSVILPVFNAARYLRQTLDNVLAQEGVEFEVIVVDDGSTDESPTILAEYEGRVVFRRQENAGQATAMNAALEIARGEYIAFLDADDLCLPGRLRIQATYLDTHPGVDLVYTPSEYIDADGQNLGVKEVREPDPLRLLYLNDIPHSSVMLRRSALESVGGFDSSYLNHDWDLWVRISEHSLLGLIRDPLVQYRVHEANVSRTRRCPLNHYRRARMTMLKKTRSRRGDARWLTAAYVRAWLEWRLLSNPVWSERGGRLWWRSHVLVNAVEMHLVQWTVGAATYPLPWRQPSR